MKKLFRWFNESFLIRLNDNKYLFKLLTTLLVLDFIAFVSLANVNPFMLLNPVQFLGGVAVDNRVSYKMFYPLSMIDEQKKAEIPTEQLAKEVMQKVYLDTNKCINLSRANKIECNALQILHELQLGPVRTEVMVKRVLKDKELVRTVWFHNGTLVLDLNLINYNKIEDVDKKLVHYTFENSLKTNLPEIQKIEWVYSGGSTTSTTNKATDKN